MTSIIKELRETNGLTQTQLAELLSVSKQTVIKYEKDTSAIPAATLKRLSEIFDIAIDDLVRGTLPKGYSYRVKNGPAQQTKKSETRDMRISIPRRNIEKFKEALLYIAESVGARSNVGETVLYKLLYFIDFDYYEKYEEQILGAVYIKNHFGPTPVDFAKITQQMAKAGELDIVQTKYFSREQKKYLPRRKANLSLFSATEIKHIDECLARYAEMNANEISAYSHKDVPWIVAEDRKPIAYEAVFYRTEETSVREYEDDDDA